MLDRKDTESSANLKNHALTLMGLLAPLLSELKFGQSDFEVTYNDEFKKEEKLVNAEFFHFNSFASPLKNGAQALVTGEENGLPACSFTFLVDKDAKKHYDMYFSILLAQTYEFQKNQARLNDRRWSKPFDGVKKFLRIPSDDAHKKLIKEMDVPLPTMLAFESITIKENGERFFPANITKIICGYSQDIFFHQAFIEYLMKLIHEKCFEDSPSYEEVAVSFSLFNLKQFHDSMKQPDDNIAIASVPLIKP